MFQGLQEKCIVLKFAKLSAEITYMASLLSWQVPTVMLKVSSEGVAHAGLQPNHTQ